MTDKNAAPPSLHTVYASQGGVTAVFSAKVAEYVASRPDYPAALFDELAIRCTLPANALIADIGAGTGLLTASFLQRGCRTIAVEPNDPMREAADSLLQAYPGYRSTDGCAETTGIEDGIVDLVTAAQAFHWFKVDEARRECLRILKPNGNVALIWNDRVSSSPLNTALNTVFFEFGGNKLAAMLNDNERKNVPAFFGGAFDTFDFPHEQKLDLNGLMSLVFSRSYMPARDTEDGRRALERVEKVFEEFSADGTVTIAYRTVAMLGRPVDID